MIPIPNAPRSLRPCLCVLSDGLLVSRARSYADLLTNLAAGGLSEAAEGKTVESVSRLVVPGDLAHSRLLLQPLALKDGGNPYHSGGRQFESKNDPDWKVLAQWVSGQKKAAK